jgi:hypothetical protein
MLKTYATRFFVFAAIAALSIPMASQASGVAGGDDEVVVYNHPDYSTILIEGRGAAERVDFFLIVRGGDDNVHARQVTEFVAGAKDADGMLVRDAVLKVKFGDGKEIELDVDRRTSFEHVWKEPGNYKVSFKLFSRDGARLARGHTRPRVRNRLRTVMQILADSDIEPGQNAQFRFVANLEEARTVRGELTVNWDDGYSNVIKNFDGDVTRTHSYSREGIYRVTATLRPESGTKTQTRMLPVTVSESTTIDLADAVIAPNSARDIASFRVTSQVTSVTISTRQICIYHTKSGQWPVRDGNEGNPWVAAYVNGQLHAGTYEWLRPGQVCKGITKDNIGPHVKMGPLANWRPRQGETLYFFVSTQSRLSSRSTNERAEPFEVVWPH